jgi:hypothetical protein
MAHFYDAVNTADLDRVETLLRKGGIEYSLRIIGSATDEVKEILVAEEDVAKAEGILYGKYYPYL